MISADSCPTAIRTMQIVGKAKLETM